MRHIAPGSDQRFGQDDLFEMRGHPSIVLVAIKRIKIPSRRIALGSGRNLCADQTIAISSRIRFDLDKGNSAAQAGSRLPIGVLTGGKPSTVMPISPEVDEFLQHFGLESIRAVNLPTAAENLSAVHSAKSARWIRCSTHHIMVNSAGRRQFGLERSLRWSDPST